MEIWAVFVSGRQSARGKVHQIRSHKGREFFSPPALFLTLRTCMLRERISWHSQRVGEFADRRERRQFDNQVLCVWTMKTVITQVTCSVESGPRPGQLTDAEGSWNAKVPLQHGL